PPEPLLFAIRKQDGKLAWKTALVASTQMGPQTSHATPLIWKDQIVLHRPGEVSAHSFQDGKKLWWFPTPSAGTSTLSAGGDVIYINAYNMGADPAGAVALPPFSEALAKYDKDKDGKLSFAEAPANDLFFLRRVGVPDNVPGAHFNIKQFFRFI